MDGCRDNAARPHVPPTLSPSSTLQNQNRMPKASGPFDSHICMLRWRCAPVPKCSSQAPTACPSPPPHHFTFHLHLPIHPYRMQLQFALLKCASVSKANSSIAKQYGFDETTLQYSMVVSLAKPRRPADTFDYLKQILCERAGHRWPVRCSPIPKWFTYPVCLHFKSFYHILLSLKFVCDILLK